MNKINIRQTFRNSKSSPNNKLPCLSKKKFGDRNNINDVIEFIKKRLNPEDLDDDELLFFGEKFVLVSSLRDSKRLCQPWSTSLCVQLASSYTTS